MRSGQLYEKTKEREGPAPGSHYASVTSFEENRCKYQSKVTRFSAPAQPVDFLETLRSHPNQEMWREMRVDEDGEWILEALLEGTLDIAHDGSCQPEISKDVCSTAVLFRCRNTKIQLFATFAEKSPDASSYRSDILGVIATQLIIRAATHNVQREYPKLPIYYDNQGVLNHGGKAKRELKEKQAQFDVLHVMKDLVMDSPADSLFRWVEGHSVRKKGKKTVPYRN